MFCNSQLKRRIEFIYNDVLIIVHPLLFCLFSASHCSNRKTCSVNNFHSAILVLDCSGSTHLYPVPLHFNGSCNTIRDFGNAANYFSCASESHFVLYTVWKYIGINCTLAITQNIYSQLICSLDFTKIPRVLQDKEEKRASSTRHVFLQMLLPWLVTEYT